MVVQITLYTTRFLIFIEIIGSEKRYNEVKQGKDTAECGTTLRYGGELRGSIL